MQKVNAKLLPCFCRPRERRWRRMNGGVMATYIVQGLLALMLLCSTLVISFDGSCGESQGERAVI